ncbi:MAG: hypothetical protein IPF51_09440 [Dehalococcoidia bacterium]|uniref:hypothetical protein n=1 Tax=Candidatus Amarobacter glycogenicus TaxID=3140699 RepID=UPI003135FCB3|nr:hypothetical protein [Dehalococcoidia bacterium]
MPVDLPLADTGSAQPADSDAAASLEPSAGAVRPVAGEPLNAAQARRPEALASAASTAGELQRLAGEETREVQDMTAATPAMPDASVTPEQPVRRLAVAAEPAPGAAPEAVLLPPAEAPLARETVSGVVAAPAQAPPPATTAEGLAPGGPSEARQSADAATVAAPAGAAEPATGRATGSPVQRRAAESPPPVAAAQAAIPAPGETPGAPPPPAEAFTWQAGEPTRAGAVAGEPREPVTVPSAPGTEATAPSPASGDVSLPPIDAPIHRRVALPENPPAPAGPEPLTPQVDVLGRGPEPAGSPADPARATTSSMPASNPVNAASNQSSGTPATSPPGHAGAVTGPAASEAPPPDVLRVVPPQQASTDAPAAPAAPGSTPATPATGMAELPGKSGVEAPSTASTEAIGAPMTPAGPAPLLVSRRVEAVPPPAPAENEDVVPAALPADDPTGAPEADRATGAVGPRRDRPAALSGEGPAVTQLAPAAEHHVASIAGNVGPSASAQRVIAEASGPAPATAVTTAAAIVTSSPEPVPEGLPPAARTSETRHELRQADVAVPAAAGLPETAGPALAGAPPVPPPAMRMETATGSGTSGAAPSSRTDTGPAAIVRRSAVAEPPETGLAGFEMPAPPIARELSPLRAGRAAPIRQSDHPSAAGATEPPSPPALAASSPIQRVVTAVPPPVALAAPAPLAPPPIHREVSTGSAEATGVITGLEPATEAEKPLDFGEVAEKVWPHLRRRLRLERERERGLPG